MLVYRTPHFLKNYSQFIFIVFFLSLGFTGLGHDLENYAEHTHKSKIKVGVYNNPPQVFVDDENKPRGIFIDIIDFIAEKEKLNIEYVHNDWSSLIAMLKTGDIDILPDIVATPVRDSVFILSELPILSSWLEVYTSEGVEFNTVHDLGNKKIGVLQKSVEAEYLERVLKPEHNLSYTKYEFSDYSTASQSLLDGTVDVLIAERFFRFSKDFDERIVPTGVSFRPIHIHFAFPKNDESDNLAHLFNKNIALLLNNPESIYYKSLIYWMQDYYVRFIPEYVLWIGLVILFIIILVLAFFIILRYQVYQKTKSLQHSNAALKKATFAAQESDRLKTAFLQNISHEIRTPMNGILGFLELLQEPDLDAATQQEFVQLVNKSGQRLLNTVNDIIEVSMIESEPRKIQNTLVDLEQLMNYKLSLYTHQVEEKGLELILSADCIAGEDALVLVDKVKLEVILAALLNNAVKFTNEGSIELGNYIQEDLIVFYVKDTGIGVPSTCIESIFERFVQAECQRNRTHEGSGLGLTIAKAYVEDMGGKIWLNSEPEKGSVFFFSIPYLPAPKL